MTEYDPITIRDYADQLYTRANWIIAEYVIGGFLLGGAGGGVWAYIMATNPNKLSFAQLGGLVGGALLGALFYPVGKQKALHLKAQAQQMLCWVRIESNTRPEAEQRAAHPEPPPRGQTRSLDD